MTKDSRFHLVEALQWKLFNIQNAAAAADDDDTFYNKPPLHGGLMMPFTCLNPLSYSAALTNIMLRILTSGTKLSLLFSP